MSTQPVQRKPTATDYSKWEKFDAKAHGVEDEAQPDSEPVASKKWMDRMAEVEASKKRLAEYEKEKVRLEQRMKDLERQRVVQERWFMGVGVALFLFFTFGMQWLGLNTM